VAAPSGYDPTADQATYDFMAWVSPTGRQIWGRADTPTTTVDLPEVTVSPTPPTPNVTAVTLRKPWLLLQHGITDPFGDKAVQMVADAVNAAALMHDCQSRQ
jgi:hypothetical protein